MGRSISAPAGIRSGCATWPRPAVSASYVAGEELAVTVHGQAELFAVLDPAHGELRQAMLDHYLPKQGPEFETWLDQSDPVGARIAAEKIFTFAMETS
jgi:hypothetical protein